MATSLFAFVLGALLLWLGWRGQQKVKASMSWPYVLGKVVAASVRQVVERGDADTRDTTNYVPFVQYEYQVGGQNYQGNRLAFQEKGYNSHKKAFKLVADFPVEVPCRCTSIPRIHRTRCSNGRRMATTSRWW